MKRAVSLLLSLVLLLSCLSGCRQPEEQPEPPAPISEPTELLSVQELAEAVLSASGKEDTLEVERLNREADPDRLAAYIEAVCGLAPEAWEDAAVIRGMGASAFEIVVLRLGDEDAAKELDPALAEYLTARGSCRLRLCSIVFPRPATPGRPPPAAAGGADHPARTAV